MLAARFIHPGSVLVTLEGLQIEATRYRRWSLFNRLASSCYVEALVLGMERHRAIKLDPVLVAPYLARKVVSLGLVPPISIDPDKLRFNRYK